MNILLERGWGEGETVSSKWRSGGHSANDWPVCASISAGFGAAESTSTGRGLIGDRQGSAAVIFALLLLPLIFSIGAIADLSRAYAAREKLSYALRAAGAAFDAETTNDKAAEDKAEAVFEQYRLSLPVGSASDLEIGEKDGKATLIARARIEAPFLTHFGIDTLPITVSRAVDQSRRSGR